MWVKINWDVTYCLLLWQKWSKNLSVWLVVRKKQESELLVLPLVPVWLTCYYKLMPLVEVQGTWYGPQFLQNVLPNIPEGLLCASHSWKLSTALQKLVCGVLFKVTSYDTFSTFYFSIYNQESLFAFPIPIDKVAGQNCHELHWIGFHMPWEFFTYYLLLHNKLPPKLSFFKKSMMTFILEGSFGINIYSKTKRLKINELVAQPKVEILRGNTILRTFMPFVFSIFCGHSVHNWSGVSSYWLHSWVPLQYAFSQSSEDRITEEKKKFLS